MARAFVGKGDVQSAFNLNNGVLQNALIADKQAVKFKYSQPAEQTVTETSKQTVTQSVDEVVKRTVSCVVVMGGDRNPVEHERYGGRNGSRSGVISGIRTGTRVGTATGTVASAISGDPRLKTGQNQFTGFDLSGKGTPTFESSGVTWDGEMRFDTTYDQPQMGDTAWGGWGQNSDPTENPASCLSGNENVEDLIDVTKVVDTTYGNANFGPVESSTTPGEVTTTGIGSLLASYQGGAFKTIWPTPVVA